MTLSIGFRSDGCHIPRTASFSLAFELLGIFSFLVFWTTRQSLSKA